VTYANSQLELQTCDNSPIIDQEGNPNGGKTSKEQTLGECHEGGVPKDADTKPPGDAMVFRRLIGFILK
jgi:hypothetical protein